MIDMLKMVYEDSYLRMINEDSYNEFYELDPLPVYDLFTVEDVVDLYNKNKLEITNYVFDAIQYLLTEDIIEMPVFKLNIAGSIARISVNRENVDKLLKECIVNYEEIEEYEKCALAVKLIDDPLNET